MRRIVFSMLAVAGYASLIVAIIGKTISLYFLVIGLLLISIVGFFDPSAFVPPPLSRFRLFSYPPEMMGFVRLLGKIAAIFAFCVAAFLSIVVVISLLR